MGDKYENNLVAPPESPNAAHASPSGVVFTNKPPPPPPPAAPAVTDEICCPITFEPIFEAQTCVPCGHTFSKQGIQDHLATQRREDNPFTCPECRAYVDPKKIMTAYAVQAMAAKYA